ncbi:response regulator [Actinoplanes awajinensis]|uniref:Response regulatory domain-containing protein n=1 Tax=Actinoplanes awajinensis subsp. mycoplanecinus TaxID=135947 RepID=A0A101J9S8_9ACTN|nr:response regulator [Actinoplanes awajinensis]KUL22823.1 hypothetical protein ADL15_47405 [Actinoplanes awajinensis subsp. mycoplanecinus]
MADSAGRIEILLVQDDPADALLLSDDLGIHKVVNKVQVAHDVTTALAYLMGTAPFIRPAVPDLVLLDLNLPGRNGRVLLERLRADPITVAIPVILLVDSPAAEQIVRAQFLPVQGYVVKPVDFDRLALIVRSLDGLGFQFVRTSCGA